MDMAHPMAWVEWVAMETWEAIMDIQTLGEIRTTMTAFMVVDTVVVHTDIIVEIHGDMG